ncbi:MAG TPA: hypothetical protein VIP70_07260 [Nitrososphaeraceae archaeon]
MKNQKTVTIAAILSAAVLIAGIVAVTTTTPMTAYADRDYKKDKDGKDDRDDRDGKDRDYKKKDKDGKGGDTSETNTPQKLYQENVGSGYSTNTNCGQNTINSIAIGVCQNADVDIDLPFSGGLGGPMQ